MPTRQGIVVIEYCGQYCRETDRSTWYENIPGQKNSYYMHCCDGYDGCAVVTRDDFRVVPGLGCEYDSKY